MLTNETARAIADAQTEHEDGTQTVVALVAAPNYQFEGRERTILEDAGVDLEALLVSQPSTFEEAAEITAMLIRSRHMALVVYVAGDVDNRSESHEPIQDKLARLKADGIHVFHL